jgi:hypothetical protein
MAVLEDIKELPRFYVLKSKKCAYVRTYRNVRKKDSKGKSVAVKDPGSCKTVGRISDPGGFGPVSFTPEFLEERPDLTHVNVIRCHDGKDGALAWKITPKMPEDTIRRPKSFTYTRFGAVLAFVKILKKDPAVRVLTKTFGRNRASFMISYAMYLALCPEGRPAGYARFASETWLPDRSALSPSQICRNFQGITEAEIAGFFSDYMQELSASRKMQHRRFWALDSTSESTYSRNLSLASRGRNKQGEALPQINIVLLTDERTGVPVFYQAYDGSVPDVATVGGLCRRIKLLQPLSFVAVMDRGYYSHENLADFYHYGLHFVCCVPRGRTSLFNDAISRAELKFLKGFGFDTVCKRFCYGENREFEYSSDGVSYKTALHVHVYFSEKVLADEREEIMYKKSKLSGLLRSGVTPDQGMKDFISDFCDLNEYGQPVFSTKKYQENCRYLGYLVLISDCIESDRAACRAYQKRQKVEDCFRTVKDRMNCRRPGVSTDEALCGKVFIQYLALGLYMRLEKGLEDARDSGGAPCNSLAQLLGELNAISQLTLDTSDQSVLNPVSAMQRKCLALYDLTVPENGVPYEADVWG